MRVSVVLVIKLYSSHPMIPQTKSPALNSGCPESNTFATHTQKLPAYKDIYIYIYMFSLKLENKLQAHYHMHTA